MRYVSFPIFREVSFPIGGFQSGLDNADYVVLGVEFDETASYREGCNEAPDVIRQAANNLETLNVFNRKDIADSLIHDFGNIVFKERGDLFNSLRHTLGAARRRNQVPMMLGGEHTILAATGQPFKNALFLMVDAHCDLRSSYKENFWSHASAARRLLDVVQGDQLIQVGIRAISAEEIEFAKENNVRIYFSHEYSPSQFEHIVKTLDEQIDSYDGLYISVDMDGFDPAYVPGVGNPEPIGLKPLDVFRLIMSLPSPIGMDICELNPKYDPSGSSAVVAARLAMTLLTR